MKKIYFALLFLITFQLFSQNLYENIDEFTDVKKTETQIDKLISKGIVSSSVLKYSFLLENNELYFNARIKLHGGETVFSIGKDFRIIFLLDDKNKIIVNSLKNVISSPGAASDSFFGTSVYSAKVKYTFQSENDIDILKNSIIKKIRVYTDKGYFEGKVKKSKAIDLSNNLKKITQHK